MRHASLFHMVLAISIVARSASALDRPRDVPELQRAVKSFCADRAGLSKKTLALANEQAVDALLRGTKEIEQLRMDFQQRAETLRHDAIDEVARSINRTEGQGGNAKALRQGRDQAIEELQACDRDAAGESSALDGAQYRQREGAAALEKEKEAKERRDSLDAIVHAAVRDPRVIAERIVPASDLKPGEAVKLFTELHPSRFVFAREALDEAGRRFVGQARNHRRIAAGEALILTAELPGNVAQVLTIDGDQMNVIADRLSLAPLPGKKTAPIEPSWIAAYDPAVKAGGNYWDVHNDYDQGYAIGQTPGWTKLAMPGDPDVEKFMAEKERVSDCYDKQLARLDPNNRRGNYDQVTYEHGQQTKVESLYDVIERKACAPCGCNAFQVKKRAHAKRALAQMQNASFETLKPAITRLKDLFPGGR